MNQQIRCPRCGYLLSPKDQFCKNCGQKMPKNNLTVLIYLLTLWQITTLFTNGLFTITGLTYRLSYLTENPLDYTIDITALVYESFPPLKPLDISIGLALFLSCIIGLIGIIHLYQKKENAITELKLMVIIGSLAIILYTIGYGIIMYFYGVRGIDLVNVGLGHLFFFARMILLYIVLVKHEKNAV